MATAERKAYARCRGRIDYANFGRCGSVIRSSSGGASATHRLIQLSAAVTPDPSIHPQQQLLSLTPSHNGGLLPLSFGLFHQQEVVRDLTVDLFTHLRMFPVSFPFHSIIHLSRYSLLTSCMCM